MRLRSGSRAFIFLLSAIFAVAGIAMTLSLTIKPLSAFLSSKSWVEVPCRIVSSEVEVNEDSDGFTYRVRIAYEYEYRGRSYHGRKYDFSEWSSSGYDPKKAVVDRYPPGRRTVCYVNAVQPGQSVINRDFGAYLLLTLFPLPFLLVGLGGIVYGVRREFAAAGRGRALEEATYRQGADTRTDHHMAGTP